MRNHSTWADMVAYVRRRGVGAHVFTAAAKAGGTWHTGWCDLVAAVDPVPLGELRPLCDECASHPATLGPGAQVWSRQGPPIHIDVIAVCMEAESLAAETPDDLAKMVKRQRRLDTLCETLKVYAQTHMLPNIPDVPEVLRDLCESVANSVADARASAVPTPDRASATRQLASAAGVCTDEPHDATPVVLAMTGTGGRSHQWALAVALWAVRDDGNTVVFHAPMWVVPWLSRIKAARYVQLAGAADSRAVEAAARLWDPGARGPCSTIAGCLEAATLLD